MSRPSISHGDAAGAGNFVMAGGIGALVHNQLVRLCAFARAQSA